MTEREKSDLFWDSNLLVCPGDLLDRLTILSIKSVRLWGDHNLDRVTIHQESERLWILWRKILSFYPVDVINQIRPFQDKLYNINSEQWDWEDRVRSEQSWEAAVGARECNTRRVAVKNEINKLLGYPVEQKMYKQKEEKNEPISDKADPQEPEVPEVPKV